MIQTADSGDDESGICPLCGSKLVEYKFGFNQGLATFLARLFEAGGLSRTDDLGLSYPQRTNSQKLAYWGLAEQWITAETIRKRGWWKITRRGLLFALGMIQIPKFVFTRRGKVTRFEKPNISFFEASHGYEFHGDYADQVRRQLGGGEQGELEL
jgi:hypothetical protein